MLSLSSNSFRGHRVVSMAIPGMEPMKWTLETDRRLLNAVDNYVNEYGSLYNGEDWFIIAYRAFERMDQSLEALSRYAYLRHGVTIDNVDDKNQSWKEIRQNCIAAIRDERSLQRALAKEEYKKTAKDIQCDLTLLFGDLNMDAVYSRQLWKYLGVAERISFSDYLDVADKWVHRLPFTIQDDRQWGVEFWEFDMKKLQEKWGMPLDRSRNQEKLKPDLAPEQEVSSCDDKLFDPLVRKRLEAYTVRKMMEERSWGFFSCTEWILLCKNERFRVGKQTEWMEVDGERIEVPESNLFEREMDKLGIVTTKNHQEVMFEFYAYVLPNYHLLGDTLTGNKETLDEESLLPQLPVTSSVWDDKFTTVYHTLTRISIEHVRKTIIHLIAIGVLGCNDSMTVKQWVDWFVDHLISLPCGECWFADPSEFELVRKRLLMELKHQKDNGVIPIDSFKGMAYKNECCIKRGDCYWKKGGSGDKK